MIDISEIADPIIFNIYFYTHNMLNVDSDIWISRKKMNAGKKKYGLSVNEKFGLVIIGIEYTTVLTSDRYLMFCENNNGVIRVKNFKWSNIRDVTHKNDNMEMTFIDGSSWELPDRIFCDDTAVECNYTSVNSDLIISIIKQKINGKNNLKQVP